MDFRSKNLMRLVAFVLAVMLWLVVRTGSDTAALPKTPVDRVTDTLSGTPEILLMNNQMTVVGNVPEVTITISGERLRVLEAKTLRGRIRMVADARGLGEGVHEIPVQVEGLPENVTYQPVRIPVRLEANQQQLFAVELVVEGQYDPAKLQDVKIEPKQVTLTGAPSILQQIKKVQARLPAQFFDTPGVPKTVSIQALNENGKQVNVTIQPKTVDVTYQPASVKKEFTKLQPEIKGLGKDLRVLLPAEGLTLQVEGSAGALETLKPEDIRLVLDVTDLAPGDYVREVAVILPPTVKRAGTTPLKIPIKIISAKTENAQPTFG